MAYGSQNPSETGPSAFGFALAIGVGAQADGRANSTAGGIAIGQEVTATNTNSIVIGQLSEASGSHAITIGRGSSATNTGAMAFGYATNATGPASLAIGRQTNAKAYKSVAIGPDSIVNAQKASSSYEFSGSNGTPSPAGYDTETITVNSGSAPASGAVAGNYYNAGSAVAIGDSASVSDESSGAVVVGPNAKTNGNAHYSVVLGSGSHADASDGFVGGHGSYVESRESIAMGSGANVRGNENIRSQAIGYGATVSGTGAYDATAIGATAQVSGVQGGVALGAGSMLDRTTASNENAGWNSKNLNGTAIRNRAYTADLTGHGDQWDSGRINTGAVSVGNDTQKRQIINVAAGNKDTDAVNVAQLKNVGVRVGADTNTATITVGSNTSNVAADFLAYNGQLNIKGDNNRVTTVSENDANGKDANVNVKFDYDGLVKAKTGSAVTVDQKTDAAGKTYFEIDAAAGSKTVVADGKNTTVTGAGTTASPYKVNVEGALTGISSITNNGGGKIEFTTSGTTISGGPVNVSNNKITGVADGDVSSTSKDAVNGSQLHAVKTAERHIAPTTAGHEYTVDSNGDVTMTYLDGNNNAVANEKAVIKGIAKNDLSNINDAGKNVITGLGTIVKAGDNVNVSESSDATTGQKTYTVNAVTPAVYTKADGTKVYKRPDGTFTTNSNLAAGNNVDKGDVITSFMDGNGNTTGGNMVINNVGSAIDKTGTSTGNTFLTKLDTAATNTPNAAVNVKDLKNTSDALINKGLNFTGNNDATVNAHKLGSLVKVQGEGVAATAVPSFASAAGNIAVVADGTDTLEIKLNKNLKGINSVSNGSSSITLNSNPGGTGNTPAVSITGGNLSMGNNKIVNLAPGTADTDAVNYSQIKDLRSEVKAGTGGVTVGKTQGTDGHDIYTVSVTGGTGGAASTWNIKSSATDGVNKGITTATNISDTKTVEMQAGKNLTVKQTATADGASVEFALNKDLTNLDKVVVNGKDGIDGKDGVSITGPKGESASGAKDGQDGKVGIAGKDGKDAVSISGKDGVGHIGLTGPAGKDGKNATADITVKEGKAGVDGKDGITRIVYQDKDGNEHEVATHDDGMKFAGDDGQENQDTNAKVIKKHLNNVVDIIGGADKDKLTDKNIGVNNDNGKLKVQLAKDVDLTKDGSLTIGDTKITKDGLTITGGPSVKKDGINAGDKKITNVADGAVTATSKDAVNGSQLHAVKAAERHIKPDTYTVANDGSVTLNYVDGDGNDTSEKAKITGIAKQDLSNITDAGKKVITGLGTKVAAGDNVTVSSTEDANGTKTYTVNAKLAKVTDGKNTTVEGTGTDANPYKVNVQGALTDISSITNTAGSGKISFAGNQVVTVEGDHSISLDGKGGYVTGLQNKDWDITNPTVVSGRAATEDQLKKVSDGFNNTVKLTGNSGATGTQKLNQNGGLSFGVVGANNGQYIKTSASGSDVVADLSDDAKAKLNHKVEVQGVGSNVHVTEDTSNAGKTIYKVAVDAASPTAASTESVVKKAVTGDTNIADISVAGGKNTGDAGAQYEVSVSRNAVKDAAREAVTINNGGTTTGGTYTPNADNPITVTPKQDATNHNTTYEVTFDGNKAAKQIPLTYKATNNGTTTADQTVKLSDGLNFTGGNYTTASVAANGVVKFDVNLGDAPTVTNGKPGVPGAAGVPGKDGIATISKVVETINNSGWQANAIANGGTLVGNATATVVKPGNTVNYAAGKNLTVKQEIAANGDQTYTYALNKDLTNLDKVVVNGKDGVDGHDGVSITGPKGESAPGAKDGQDGKVGIAGKDGKDAVSISGKDGVGHIGLTGPAGKDGKNATADITVKDGVPGVDGQPGETMTRIVYKDKDGNEHQVATHDDGMKFAGDDGQANQDTNAKVIKKHLNNVVDIIGGADKDKLTDKNIGVNNDNGKLKVQLAKDVDLTKDGSLTIGDTNITKDGLTITGGPSITKTGINAGDKKITNVADGAVNATSKDAVNGSQLHAVKAAERHIKPDTYTVANDGSVTLNYVDGDGNDTSEKAKITGIAKQDLSNITNEGKKEITKLGTIVKAGNNVTVTSASDATTGRTTYTVNAITPAVYTDKDGNKVYKQNDGSWNTAVDGSGTTVPNSDVITSFENPNAPAGTTTKDGGMIVNNIGSAIKNQTPTMPAGQTATYLDKLKAAADDTKTQNAAVNVSDLHNTANALKDNELHIAPTAVKSGSTEVKGGAPNAAGTENVYKYDAATKKVTLTYNDGNGKAVADTKAVIDLSELAGSIQNYGFKTNAAGNLETGTNATATAVASGKTVTYAAGKNLTVKQEIGTDDNQTYTYALNKDLTNLDKVVVNGKDGQPGKDGVTIIGPQGATGTPGTNGIDGKVGISGKDGKDAVSISGKDGVGHIGLTGPQGPQGPAGTPGTPGANIDISTDHGTQTLVKPEANNDNKSERIVYVPKDKDGNPLKDTDGNVIKREVATMDDGLKFAGDDGTVIKKALGTQLDIIGGADSTKLTDNNIGVNNDNGKLKVQLAQNIDLTKDGSVTMGNTKVNKDGITITKPATATDPAKTVSLTGDGLNNGGNKITNVKAGEDPTDAVNVQQLKDNVTTVESSDSSIKVVDKNVPGSATYDATKGHQYDITINNQSVVEHAQTPVVYTDKDGNKLYKIVNPTTNTVTFNTKEDGTGTTVQPGDVIASMNNGGDSTTTPMKLNNVGSSIQKPNSTDTFLKQLDDANKNTPNGAVNVSDLKKTSDALIDKGLVFDANNKDPKTNKLGSKVTIAGTGALANGENFADKYDTDNIRTNITQDPTTGNTTVEIGLNKNLKGLESVSVPGKDGVDGRDGVSITGKDGANGIDGKVGIGKDGKDAVSISGKDGIGHIGLTGPAGKDGKNATADITVKEGKAGVDGKDGVDGITRIVYNDKDGNEHQVATHDDGLKFTGNNVSTENKHKLNSVVKVQGEGVTENATSGKLEVNGQEFKSAAGNIAVVADGDKTLTVKMNKDLNLTKDGSVTMGDTVVNNDGITITGGPSVTKTGINAGNKAITNVANGTNDSDAVNVSQLKGSITTVKSSDGSITVTDDNASTDPTKGHAYDIKVNSQGVVNNAQLPVVYTDKDGNKLYLVNGQFYKTKTPVPGTDQPVDTGDVIASMNNGGDSTTTPMKLNNVGSSIANETGATFLDKLDSAKTNTPNGAVNVTDLKSTADAIGEKGLNFGAQSGNDIHKNLGEKLEIVGGGTKTDDKYDASNIKTMTKDGKVVIALDKDLKADSVTVGEKGQPGVPGKDGVDGKIGVNGKDGSAVVINGKDGSIGLNGKDGANGITIKGDKGVDGVDGVNGTNGINRIVYQDKDGNNHEVATHDDGMKFAGDDGQTNQDTNPKVIKKHLNKVVDIVGGADKTKLTDNNIGVNNDGGKLRVQLANELSGINKISNGNSSISIADVPAGATTPAVTISGGNLSMGDNKITNVKAGTNDTDAVNYKQLKDSRTTVTSQDGSVTITPTQNGDSTNYDLKVNPPLDPRVDQLAEEIGRVGAQGAALSALKPIQYDPLEPTQIMAGYGNYRGNSAVALGVAHYKNESTLIHGGVSWAGGSSHMMANAGVTWKVGNRDSEAAVADRYRKGPISSTYAMQQEMAAMKAQNAGLKGEVSDLKAENEQMKAQIAAMMAKLGL